MEGAAATAPIEPNDNSGSGDGGFSPSSTVDAKILADLNVVKEKMELLENMLRPGDGSPAPSIKTDETLLGVIGFLEACAPRMIELVEAGAQGAISGEVLEQCLELNDQLMKLLADIDTMAMTETAASTTVASAPPSSSIEGDLVDLSLDEVVDDGRKKAPPSSSVMGGGKSTGEEDFFSGATAPPATTTAAADPFAPAMTDPFAQTPPPLGTNTDPFAPPAGAMDHPLSASSSASQPLAPPPASAPPPPPPPGAGATAPVKDEFDTFLEERTSSSNINTTG